MEPSTCADSSSGRKLLPEASKPSRSAVPISRLNSPRVLAGSVSRKRKARRPTRNVERASTRTTDGVSISPSALGTTASVVPSKLAIAELVVPRSIPTCIIVPHEPPEVSAPIITPSGLNLPALQRRSLIRQSRQIARILSHLLGLEQAPHDLSGAGLGQGRTQLDLA